MALNSRMKHSTQIFSLLQTGRAILLDKNSRATLFRSHLNSQLPRVFLESKNDPLYLEDNFENVLVEGWIDELLRYFIILKVKRSEDYERKHYVPSYPLVEAWHILRKDHRALHASLSAAFDDVNLRPTFDFYDGGEYRLREAYLSTIEAYKELFNSYPPQVFWLENFEENLFEPDEEDFTEQIFNLDFWVKACQGIATGGNGVCNTCTPVYGKHVVRSREILI